MTPRKIPDVVRGEIMARAWDGETFAHIARDLGVSPYQVGRIAMREGGFPTRAELIRLQGDAICAAYGEGQHGGGCEAVRAFGTGRLEHAACAWRPDTKTEAAVAVPPLMLNLSVLKPVRFPDHSSKREGSARPNCRTVVGRGLR